MTSHINSTNTDVDDVDEYANVVKVVGKTGYMTPEKGRKIFDFILEHKLSNILELGFAHGGSTSFLAGSVATLKKTNLDHNHTYQVTSIDLKPSANLQPCAEELIQELGYEELVSLYREQSSYTWRLMKMLEQTSIPQFDFCFLDGAHSWAVDGFAFLLVDKLLKPGGWILFDDLNWTYKNCSMPKDSPLVKAMSEEELVTPQVKKVYELLVKPHPNYDEFKVDGEWVYVHKSNHANEKKIVNESIQKVETIYYQSPLSHLAVLAKERFPFLKAIL